jgi:crossover junction endodeoxyribonuclease RusA
VIRFDVLGEPAPKGSMRAIMVRGHAQLIPGGDDATRSRLRTWTQAIVGAASLAFFDAARTKRAHFEEVALEIEIEFRLRKPATTKYPERPIGKPDADKLERAVLDALTGLVYDDDSRVVVLSSTKQWASPGREGATIAVRPADVEEVARYSAAERLLAIARKVGEHWLAQEGVNAALLDELAEATRRLESR